MKISSEHPVADAKEKRRQGELAFTMVEIAIAIGVIGFALVAIIGILPAGMNVQKDNREDTTIGQDAPYFMDAIRNGCPINQNYAGPGPGFSDQLCGIHRVSQQLQRRDCLHEQQSVFYQRRANRRSAFDSRSPSLTTLPRQPTIRSCGPSSGL